MKLLIVFGIIGIMLLAGCCGPVSGTASAAPNSSSTAQPQAQGSGNVQTGSQASASNVENGELGKTYTVSYLNSNYEVTLSQIEPAKSTIAYSKGNYLMAYFEIKNVGGGSEYFIPNIYVLDSSGEKYDSTIAFGVDTKYDKTLSFIKQLPPGTKTSGWVAIEVPENLSQSDLYFEYTNIYLSKTPNYIKWRINQ